MRKRCLAIVPAVLVCVSFAAAEQYPEFTAWMKAAGRTADALTKAENKTGPQVVRAAERLASVYDEMIGFWRQQDPDDAADAVKWSEQGKAAALELANAANAGNAERAAAAWKRLDGTCTACHEAHRVQAPDGTYRFKAPKPDQP